VKRFYEIVSIFAPNVTDDKLNTYVKKIKEIIASCKGNIISEENWGNRKLAYEIKKFKNGIYYFIFCETESNSLPFELKKFFSINEDVLRYGMKKVVVKKSVSKEKKLTEEQTKEKSTVGSQDK